MLRFGMRHHKVGCFTIFQVPLVGSIFFCFLLEVFVWVIDSRVRKRVWLIFMQNNATCKFFIISLYRKPGLH